MDFAISKPEKRAGHLYILFGVKSSVISLAAILVPCFLQFSLVAFGQDGADGIDGGLVRLEIISERVEPNGSVGKGGNPVGEGEFVGMNGVAQPTSSMLPVVDPRIKERHEKSADSAKKISVGSCESKSEYLHAILALVLMLLVTAWWWGYGSGRTTGMQACCA